MSTDAFIKDDAGAWEVLGGGIRRKILGYNATMMMTRVAFEAGAVGAPHRHPHHQCAVVESGVFDVTIEDRTRRLAAGDGYIVPPNVLHGVVAVEPGVLLDVFTPPREDFLA
ncbi:MAG TPA: cupin domain-containing protein [Azospirillaceae bacterium]|nr:cupin domain-containing protein [Azospirillaceae bacterium]